MPDRYFSTLARYNAWANRRLYDAVAQLSEAEYMKPRASFFGSIHAALNHILVGDRIWLARLEEKPNPKYKLDQVLYGDLVALRVAREAEDAHISNFIAGIDERRLDQILAYANTKGEKQHTPFAWCSAISSTTRPTTAARCTGSSRRRRSRPRRSTSSISSGNPEQHPVEAVQRRSRALSSSKRLASAAAPSASPSILLTAARSRQAADQPGFSFSASSRSLSARRYSPCLTKRRDRSA